MYWSGSDLRCAGIPRARVDRERAPLLSLHDGSADSRLLLDAVGLVRRPARRAQRGQARDLLPAPAHVRAAVDDAGGEGWPGLLQHELFTISLSAVSNS